MKNLLQWLRGNRADGNNRQRRQADYIPKDQEIKTAMADLLLADMLRERKSEQQWRKIRRTMFVLVTAASLIMYVFFYATAVGYKLLPRSETVGVVRVQGEIANGEMASADKVIPVLQRAFDLPSVKAIILSIDSPGGAPVETERIYRAMDEMRKENPKPVIAVINNMGASAAYLLAIHADQIYAGKYSLVGSVGAVIAGWDLHKAMDKVEVSQRIYASGKLKAMLNPFIPSNTEADEKAQSLVDAMGGSFKDEVMKARHGKLLPNVNYTTGEVWNGVDAKRIGLVDGIGTIEEIAKSKWNLDTYDFGPYPNQMHLPFMKTMARYVVSSLFGIDTTAGFSVH